jgi:hypothetical protein
MLHYCKLVILRLLLYKTYKEYEGYKDKNRREYEVNPNELTDKQYTRTYTVYLFLKHLLGYI